MNNLFDLLCHELKGKSSFIDLGCGWGNDCALVKQTFPEMRVVGIDIVKSVISFCRTYYRNITFKTMDVRKLTFKKNEFDMALSHGVLIHVPKEDIRKTIKKIMKVCRNYMFVESSGKENKGNLKYDPREYWAGRFKRAEPTAEDHNTQYYFSHDYFKEFKNLGYRLDVLYDFKDDNKTRVYLCQR